MINKEEVQKNVRKQLDQAIVKGERNVMIYPSSNSSIEKDIITKYLNELGYEIGGFQGDKDSIISYFVDLYKPRKQPLYDATDRPFRSFEQWAINHQNHEKEKMKEAIEEINRQISSAYEKGTFSFSIYIDDRFCRQPGFIKYVTDYISSLGLTFTTPFTWNIWSNSFTAVISVPEEYQYQKKKKERKRLWRK